MDERYVCPICREVFKSPVYISECKHMFCSLCIQQLPPTNYEGTRSCPICRNHFMLTDLKRNLHFNREIAMATMTCGTCGVQCRLTEWNQHISTHPPAKPHPPSKPHPPQHQSRPPPNRSTFSCPLCSQDNLTPSDLIVHVNSCHGDSRAKVVCPVCSAMPWGVASQVSQNFVQHLNMRHKFEYETYVDYGEDEDSTLKEVLKASLTQQ